MEFVALSCFINSGQNSLRMEHNSEESQPSSSVSCNKRQRILIESLFPLVSEHCPSNQTLLGDAL